MGMNSSTASTFLVTLKNHSHKNLSEKKRSRTHTYAQRIIHEEKHAHPTGMIAFGNPFAFDKKLKRTKPVKTRSCHVKHNPKR